MWSKDLEGEGIGCRYLPVVPFSERDGLEIHVCSYATFAVRQLKSSRFFTFHSLPKRFESDETLDIFEKPKVERLGFSVEF